MVDAGLAAAIGFALTGGVATFFSPCAYALLPGYVGFYASRADGGASLAGALARGVAAAAGAVVTLAAMFAVSFWAGHRVFENLLVLEPVVGLVVLAFGVLVLAGRAPSISVPLPRRRVGVAGFGVFGAGYAVASAGCVAPIFVAVVGQALTFSAGGATLLIATYVGVIAVLMLSLTVATGMGLLAGASRLAAHHRRLEQVAGVVMILAGLGQLYVAFAVSSGV